MTHKSGYCRPGWKSRGFTSTPSIVSPSWLFQLMTSRVPSVQLASRVERVVNARGANVVESLTYTSGSVVPDDARKPSVRPSAVKEADCRMNASGEDTRVTVRACGSTRNRCDAVFCAAVMYRPFGVHATRVASSSSVSVSEVTRPPSASTTATRPFAWKYFVTPIAEPNARRRPSGDQRGFESGPGCDTTLRTASDARSSTWMSAVPPSIRSGVVVAANATRVLSGETSNAWTWRPAPRVR
jgi:hypothetical protein